MSHDKINRSEIISTLFFHHIDKGSIKKENPLLYVSAYSLIIIFVLRFNDSSLVDIYVIVSYLEISTLQLKILICCVNQFFIRIFIVEIKSMSIEMQRIIIQTLTLA